MFFSNIDLIWVLVAAAVGMVIGFVWYSPWAFGKLWLKSKSWSDEMLRQKKEGKPMLPVYIMTFVSNVLTALVIAVLFNSIFVTSITGMVLAGFLLWLGLMVPVKFADYLFGGDTLTFFFINIGYWLVEILATSLIIGLLG